MRFKEYLRGITHGMRMRLYLYAAALVLLLCAVALGTITLFGRLSVAERQTAETLTSQLAVFEHSVTSYFDNVAARGIRLSEDLSANLEAFLLDRGLSLTDLNDNPGVIAAVEENLRDTLSGWLTQTDCSGAYFFLNATANTSLPGADSSKCGMYIKIANINAYRPADPKLVLFRGCTEAISRYALELHNMWALELNTDMFPDYELLMEKSERNLNACFLFTDAVELPGTWENVTLLCVPIVGRDGMVYGVCGFEVSRIYFKLRLAQAGASPHMTGLLAPYDSGAFDIDAGFVCGDAIGYYREITGRMTTTPTRRFQVFTSAEGAFVGAETAVRLSPLEDERRVAVMIPIEDYDRLNSANTRENLVIFLLLFLTAIFGSVFMSRSYLTPVLRGLEQIKRRGTDGWRPVNVPEIDDLMEFLSAQDREHEAALSVMEDELTRLAEARPPMATVTEQFDEFEKRIKTLTRAERKVFDLYTQGLDAHEIAKTLGVSVNTIKTHNRNIYGKLEVSSKEMMMAFVNLMGGNNANEGK